MSVKWGVGLHAPTSGHIDASAYDQYIGRWSRLFVPSVLAAAEIGAGDRVLDVATGSGEAAQMAVSAVGDSGAAALGRNVAISTLSSAAHPAPQ